MKLIKYLLGRKYYAAILGIRGTADHVVNQRIFPSREAAESFVTDLVGDGKGTFYKVEIVSFRSRNAYNICN